MVTFPIIVLLAQLFVASTPQNDGSNIKVLAVSCERVTIPISSDLEPPYSSANPGQSNPLNAGPRGVPVTAESRLEQRTSIDQRSREMSDVEDKASHDSGRGAPRQLYAYKIKLRNTGTAAIKFFIWDYESIDVAGAATSTVRTFSCSASIKPDSIVTLKATSHSRPDRVVDAKTSDEPHNQRGVINRVEYADGSVWQRPGWNLPDTARVIKPKTTRCIEVR